MNSIEKLFINSIVNGPDDFIEKNEEELKTLHNFSYNENILIKTAIINDNLKIVKYLLEIKKIDYLFENFIILEYAINLKNDDILNYLFNFIDINKHINTQQILLMIKKGLLEFIKKINNNTIAKIINIDKHCIVSNKLDIFKYFLESKIITLKNIDELMKECIKNNRLNFIKFIIKHNTKFNYFDIIKFCLEYETDNIAEYLIGELEIVFEDLKIKEQNVCCYFAKILRNILEEDKNFKIIYKDDKNFEKKILYFHSKEYLSEFTSYFENIKGNKLYVDNIDELLVFERLFIDFDFTNKDEITKYLT